jgi:hypothetical protein
MKTKIFILGILLPNNCTRFYIYTRRKIRKIRQDYLILLVCLLLSIMQFLLVVSTANAKERRVIGLSLWPSASFKSCIRSIAAEGLCYFSLDRKVTKRSSAYPRCLGLMPYARFDNSTAAFRVPVPHRPFTHRKKMPLPLHSPTSVVKTGLALRISTTDIPHPYDDAEGSITIKERAGSPGGRAAANSPVLSSPKDAMMATGLAVAGLPFLWCLSLGKQRTKRSGLLSSFEKTNQLTKNELGPCGYEQSKECSQAKRLFLPSTITAVRQDAMQYEKPASLFSNILILNPSKPSLL